MKRLVPLAPLALLVGCDLRLGRPDQLWLAWLVPLLIGFYALSASWRRKRLERFITADLWPRLVVGESRRGLKAALVVGALLCLVVAAAEPKLGFDWQVVQRRGVDLVVALDVSDSMLVQDGAAGSELPRLVRAKRELHDLLAVVEGDRVGVVAFAGAAVVQCPLTVDLGAVAQFIDELGTDAVPVKGTALGAAIRTSLKALAKSAASSRAILLMTDGEDTTSDALAAAALAKEQGVRVYTIGIGREQGAPIPSDDGSFRRDARGELILSRLDEPTLQRIAVETGGAYVRSVTGDVDIEEIYRRGIKATLEDEARAGGRRQIWHARYQWLVALAAVLLAVEALLPERARPRARGGAGHV